MFHYAAIRKLKLISRRWGNHRDVMLLHKRRTDNITSRPGVEKNLTTDALHLATQHHCQRLYLLFGMEHIRSKWNQLRPLVRTYIRHFHGMGI